MLFFGVLLCESVMGSVTLVCGLSRTALRDFVYPFVRDNAEFYASYLVDNGGNSDVMFPYSCGQEACACRNGLSWYWRWGQFVQVGTCNLCVCRWVSMM